MDIHEQPDPEISFIIPTYNEQDEIVETINCIMKYVPAKINYDITVVDNCSIDDTVKLAEELGVQVIKDVRGNVSNVRNIGVLASRGKYLVFLDADVHLTEEWSHEITETIRTLELSPDLITGSQCGLSDKPSMIEKFWFAPDKSNQKKYINSGHLITSRELFNKIGGFDADLTTGEDYDFSIRGKKSGACVVDNSKLRVSHVGFPDSVFKFVLREMWHGVGDIQTIDKYLKSKVALVSSFILLLHFFIILAAFKTLPSYVIPGSIALIAVILVASSAIKYKKFSINIKIFNTFLFYFYYLGRSMSFLYRIFSK